VKHKIILKPIFTVFVGREMRIDVFHETPFHASQPLQRRFILNSVNQQSFNVRR
jgi:hypothetical protein